MKRLCCHGHLLDCMDSNAVHRGLGRVVWSFVWFFVCLSCGLCGCFLLLFLAGSSILSATTQLGTNTNIKGDSARVVRRQTLKMQRIKEGRAKRAERDAKLSSKRAKREARAAEVARLQALPLATKYSELKAMLRTEDLIDQLKVYKARLLM